MSKSFVLLVGFLMLGTSGVFATEDFGVTNGLLPGLVYEDDDIIPVQTYRGDVFDFPTSADAWTMTYYPYWWNAGDNVAGTYVTTETVDHVEISLTLTRNSLTGGGHCDMEFRINGAAVGTFMVTEASGLGPIMEIFDFAPIAAGPLELCYYETNTVGSGLGSYDMNEVAGINSVSFSSVALERSTWGSIKASI